MSRDVIGVYGASLNLITNGHLWVIRNARRYCSKLIVAIAQNPDKKPEFSVEERIHLTAQSILEAGIEGDIEFDAFEGRYLVDYARQRGADVLIRGVRNAADYEYEANMADFNAENAPDLLTTVLFTPLPLRKVSSSFVRGLVGPEGWEKVVSRYVQPCVLDAYRQRLAAKRGA